MAKRLSLLERQNKLLQDQGFSKPPGNSGVSGGGRGRGRQRTASGHSKDFAARQDGLLQRQGRTNATGASRTAVEWGGGDDEEPDGMSTASGAFSVAPSLHPSMAGSTVSHACSEVTIGAGDDTGYWDFCHRAATKKDLGHNCRECKRPFTKVGDPLTERRGARTSRSSPFGRDISFPIEACTLTSVAFAHSRYHAECFSGFADPRSQTGSSFHTGRLAGTQLGAAPKTKAGSKMRVSRHFDIGGDSRYQGGSIGKISAFSGNNGFGARSGKNKGGAGGGVAFNALEHDLSGFEDVLEGDEFDEDVNSGRGNSAGNNVGGGSGQLSELVLAEHRRRN